MPSIFERLQKQLDIRKREQGISALELTDLPPNLRKIMRLMLREVVMKYTEITTAVEAMPPANRLSRAELDHALKVLTEQNWLLRTGQDEFISYRVNLRRRAGSQLGQDVWAALDNRIIASKPPAQKPEGDA